MQSRKSKEDAGEVSTLMERSYDFRPRTKPVDYTYKINKVIKTEPLDYEETPVDSHPNDNNSERTDYDATPYDLRPNKHAWDRFGLDWDASWTNRKKSDATVKEKISKTKTIARAIPSRVRKHSAQHYHSKNVEDDDDEHSDCDDSESDPESDSDEDQEDEFFCLYCEFGPATWKRLKDHEKNSHPLTCMICIKDLETKEHLQVHRRAVHGVRCKLCDRAFLSLSGLISHERRSFYHWCVKKSLQNLFNEMIDSFKLPLDKMPPPLYYGLKKNVVKYPECKNRVVRESCVIMHVRKLVRERTENEMEPSAKKVRFTEPEPAKVVIPVTEVDQSSDVQETVVTGKLENIVSSTQFVLSQDAVQYSEGNKLILPDLGLTQASTSSEEFPNFAYFSRDAETSAEFDFDTMENGTFMMPMESAAFGPMRQIFTNDWTFDSREFQQNVLHDMTAPTPVACPDRATVLTNNDDTIFDMDTGKTVGKENFVVDDLFDVDGFETTACDVGEIQLFPLTDVNFVTS